ncbi:hypothetical protein BST61_g1465 [Cercospora zeina]
MGDDERAAKRQKKMPDLQLNTATTQQAPGMIVDICSDGDTVLIVQGIAGVSQSVGIRVSSRAITTASPVFRRILAPSSSLAPPTPSPGTEEQREPRQIHLANDDGDALFLLLNILHLRNDALPTRIQPDLLLRFVATCARYECIVAAGRAASQWLDYIYTKLTKGNKAVARNNNTIGVATPASAAPPTTPFSATPPPTDTQTLFNLIEATLILNDALFFTRFTNHFILTQPPLTTPTTLPLTSPTQQHLFTTLKTRQTQSLHDLRLDFDLLIEPLAESLSDDNKHYTDCAPGEDPFLQQQQQPSGGPTLQPSYTICIIDASSSTTLLSSLRDANLWPATRWPHLINPTDPQAPKSQTGNAVLALEKFRVPDVDAADACYWCSHVEDRFATALGLVRMMHKDRMWGLCLDCYKAAGGMNTAGECRVEHYKAGVAGGPARFGASSNMVVLGNSGSGGNVPNGGQVLGAGSMAPTSG